MSCVPDGEPLKVILKIVTLQGCISFVYSNLFNVYLDPKKLLSNPPGILTLVTSNLATPLLFWRRRRLNSYCQQWEWDANTLFMLAWLGVILWCLPQLIVSALESLGMRNHPSNLPYGQQHPLTTCITAIFLFEVVGRCQRKETLKNTEATLRWIWITLPVTTFLFLYFILVPSEDQGPVSFNKMTHNEVCGMAFYLLLLMSRFTMDSLRNVVRIFLSFYGIPQVVRLVHNWRTGSSSPSLNDSNSTLKDLRKRISPTSVISFEDYSPQSRQSSFSFSETPIKTPSPRNMNAESTTPLWAQDHHSLLRGAIQLVIGCSILPVVIFLGIVVGSCSSANRSCVDIEV